MVLSREFYSKDSEEVAKNLLGKILAKEGLGGTVRGKIVETEAYYGEKDPASHAYNGKTPRTEIMWGQPGIAYVYFTYGMHYLFNIVTQVVGEPGAVLIRALQPLSGIELMKERRNTSLKNLTNGPAKLTQALEIDKSYNGTDLASKDELYVLSASSPKSIISSTRVGISEGTSRKLRFYIRENDFVSKK